MSLREEIRQLKFRRHTAKGDNRLVHLRSHEGSINTNMLGKFMLKVTRNADRTVLSEERGVGAETVTPKSPSSH